MAKVVNLVTCLPVIVATTAAVIVLILPLQTEALVPFKNPIWETLFPLNIPEDPFKILEETPLSLPKGIDDLILARADWKETTNEHLITLDVPGMKKEEVKIEVEENRVLSVSGERKKEVELAEGENWHRVERISGKFWRQFKLPANADLDKIKANLDNGVLKIVVPKLPEDMIKKQPKVICIIDQEANKDDVNKIDNGRKDEM